MIVLAGLQFCALVLVALLAGMHLSGTAGVNPALRSLDAAVYIPMKHALDATVVKIARPLMLASLAATTALVVAAVVTAHVTIAVLGGVALAGLVGTLGAILRGDLPINQRMSTWQAARPPADWQRVRARWELFFTVRTMTSGVALGLLAVAAFVPR